MPDGNRMAAPGHRGTARGVCAFGDDLGNGVAPDGAFRGHHAGDAGADDQYIGFDFFDFFEALKGHMKVAVLKDVMLLT